MRNRLTLILIFLLCAVVLAGCAKPIDKIMEDVLPDTPKQEKAEPTAAAEPIQETASKAIDFSQVSSSMEMLKLMEQSIQAASSEEADAMEERFELLIWKQLPALRSELYAAIDADMDFYYTTIYERWDAETGLIDLSQEADDIKQRAELVLKLQESGYRFSIVEGMLELEPDYRRPLQYSASFSQQKAEYLEIMAQSVENPIVLDGGLIMGSWNELAALAAHYESFITQYEEPELRVLHLYYNALELLMCGADNTPIFDMETGHVLPEVLSSYQSQDESLIMSQILAGWADYLAQIDPEYLPYSYLYDIAQKQILLHYGDLSAQSAQLQDSGLIDLSTDKVAIEIYKPIVAIKNQPEASAAINETIDHSINATVEWVTEAADEFFAEENELDDYVITFGAYSQYGIERNSGGILTILMTYSDYTGGAHGSYYSVAYTYKTETGKKMELGMLFKPNYDYYGVIEGIIAERIAQELEYEDSFYFDDYSGLTGGEIYIIQDHGITVLYNPYDIAPYAAGQPEFFISAEELADGLRDEYLVDMLY